MNRGNLRATVTAATLATGIGLSAGCGGEARSPEPSAEIAEVLQPATASMAAKVLEYAGEPDSGFELVDNESSTDPTDVILTNTGDARVQEGLRDAVSVYLAQESGTVSVDSASKVSIRSADCPQNSDPEAGVCTFAEDLQAYAPGHPNVAVQDDDEEVRGSWGALYQTTVLAEPDSLEEVRLNVYQTTIDTVGDYVEVQSGAQEPAVATAQYIATLMQSRIERITG